MRIPAEKPGCQWRQWLQLIQLSLLARSCAQRPAPALQRYREQRLGERNPDRAAGVRGCLARNWPQTPSPPSRRGGLTSAAQARDSLPLLVRLQLRLPHHQSHSSSHSPASQRSHRGRENGSAGRHARLALQRARRNMSVAGLHEGRMPAKRLDTSRPQTAQGLASGRPARRPEGPRSVSIKVRPHGGVRTATTRNSANHKSQTSRRATLPGGPGRPG